MIVKHDHHRSLWHSEDVLFEVDAVWKLNRGDAEPEASCFVNQPLTVYDPTGQLRAVLFSGHLRNAT